MHRAFLFGLMCGALPGCSESSTSPSSDGGTDLQTASAVVFEIDAQTGAMPRGASGTAVSEPWELLRGNVAALLGDRTISLPTASEIGPLDDVDGDDFDSAELLAIADAHADEVEDEDTVVFHVLFLDGYFLEDGQRQTQVLGVSIGDTRVIAMFAPVIGDGVLARFMEQTTLIHELGHAVGLVDNGLAMQHDHLDTEHGAHCHNERCVMYWLNEGPADLASYVQDYVATGDTVLFDDDCLDDVHAGLP